MRKRPPKRPETAHRDVHAEITAKIVAAIEAGAGDFQMPWHRPGASFAIPKNALTDKPYRGSNILSLWIDADEKRFERQILGDLQAIPGARLPGPQGRKGVSHC